MSDYSLFDIAGPIMIGPSSSHTAGAAKIGLIARHIFGKQPKKVLFNLHGSFAQVYAGHATDRALVAGILGMPTFDKRLPQAFELASQEGVEYKFRPVNLGKNAHANTVQIDFEDQPEFSVTGCSVGGGKIKIEKIGQFEVQLSCSHARQHLLLIWHKFDYSFSTQIEDLSNKQDFEVLFSKRDQNHIEKALTALVSPVPFAEELMQLIEKSDLVQQTRLISELPV